MTRSIVKVTQYLRDGRTQSAQPPYFVGPFDTRQAANVWALENHSCAGLVCQVIDLRAPTTTRYQATR